jgi:hypothetical protein
MSLENVIKEYKSELQAVVATGVILLASNVFHYFSVNDELSSGNCNLTNQKFKQFEYQSPIYDLFNYGSKIAIDNKLKTLNCD